MRSKWLLGLPLVAIAAIVACSSDPPPPPSLGFVGIDYANDHTGKWSMTYIHPPNSDGTTNYDATTGDIKTGIFLGDGLTFPVVFTRTINDPPDDDKAAQALLDKEWTATSTGDAFTISKGRTNDSVIVNTVHPGDGTIVLSVVGVTGNATVAVHVVDQNAVPQSIFPPDAPPDAGPGDDGGTEAGTDTTDAGTDAAPSGA